MRIRRTSFLIGLSFVGIALVITWPLATCADRCLSGNLGDPLLNAWIVGWGAERFADGFAGVWDAPIFHPYEDTLAYSEHLLGITALVAPVYWVSENAVLAYNVAFIAAYALAAWGMYLLARRLTSRSDVAFAIALAFASSPYLTTSQSTRLQMLYCGWMAIGLAALHGYFDTRSRARLTVFVMAYVMLGLSNMYLFVFFAVPAALVMAYGVWTAKHRGRTLVELVLAAALVAAVMAPIAGLYRDVQQNVALERTTEENVRYSAAVESYMSVWHESPLSRWLPGEDVADRGLFPGLTLIVLAFLNVPRLISWLRRRSAAGVPSGVRSWLGVYAVTVLVAFALSLGPVPHGSTEPFMAAGPYAWLMEVVPGVDGLRAPARFGAIVLLGLSSLAAIGLSTCLAGRSGLVRALAIAGVCVAAVAEGAVAPARLVHFPGTLPAAEQQAFDWLDGEPPGAVLVLPIVPDHFRERPLAGETQTLVYQYATLLHGRPIVNGSSGFKPPLTELLESEASPFRDPSQIGDAVRVARALDVRYVMLHERDFRDPRHARLVSEALRAEVDQVASERVFGNIRLFQLQPGNGDGDDRQPSAHAVPSSRFQVFASDRPHDLARTLDRNPSSGWTSGTEQLGTEWLSVYFDSPLDVAHVRLTLDDSALEHYPRRLEIVSMGPEGDVRTLFDDSPMVALALALVRRPVDHAIDLAFDENVTSQLLIRQVGRASAHPWSVQELAVWERGDSFHLGPEDRTQ